MEEKQIAAKLFKQDKKKQDSVLLTLQVLKYVKEGVDIDRVLNEYIELSEGKQLLAVVTSRFELDENTKAELSRKVNDKYSDQKVIFEFIINKKARKSLEIRVGDDLLLV